MNVSVYKPCTLLAALLCGTALCQTTLHTKTTLVVVPTIVTTEGKDVAFSLSADDFLLTDNGVPQKVTLEQDSDHPLSLVVLIQTGGAARGQFDSYTHLDTMLAEVLGKAPNKVSIVNFDSGLEGASPFTSDVLQWSDAINHPDGGDNDASILDAIAFGIDSLKQQPANTRRAILLISQGHDSGSKTSEKAVLQALSETNTAIYSVTFSAEKASIRQTFREPAHLNPPIAGHGQNYFDLGAPLSLAIGAMRKNLCAEVASLSGGEASSFDNRFEIERDLSVMASHLHNTYMLSFSPSSTDLGLHRIRVRLPHHPDLVVSARNAYWAVDSVPVPATPRPK